MTSAFLQVIRDDSPDLPSLLDDYNEFGGVCVFETIFGCDSGMAGAVQSPKGATHPVCPLRTHRLVCSIRHVLTRELKGALSAVHADGMLTAMPWSYLQAKPAPHSAHTFESGCCPVDRFF